MAEYEAFIPVGFLRLSREQADQVFNFCNRRAECLPVYQASKIDPSGKSVLIIPGVEGYFVHYGARSPQEPPGTLVASVDEQMLRSPNAVFISGMQVAADGVPKARDVTSTSSEKPLGSAGSRADEKSTQARPATKPA